MNVAIIPARGGSRRIPGKNIRDFHGKPIIAYSIEAAKASGLFARIYVSTEDHHIAEVALRYGVPSFPRPPELALDDVGTQEVMAHAVKYFNDAGLHPRFACCIYATAPLMIPTDLIIGFSKLGIRDNRYVYAVGPDGNGAGQWYWGTADAFLTNAPLDGNSEHYVLPPHRVCDINTPEDFEIAEKMYAVLHEARNIDAAFRSML